MQRWLDRFSIGVGDRFGHQGEAQLRALQIAGQAGVTITPVWNKSYREHSLIGTKPEMARAAAEEAVQAAGWKGPFFVDADHVGLKNVDLFLDACDFFTIDVADSIGQRASDDSLDAFVRRWGRMNGKLSVPGVPESFVVTDDVLRAIATKYLKAIQEAGEIYRHIASKKEAGSIVVEVSMDETMQPQSPLEMIFILAAIADEKIPAQTIAPKFSGKFLKGIDYVGSVPQFATEFEADVHVVKYAIDQFGLPKTLKLSIHSGSDKFSLYPVIHSILQKTNAGVHLKTAGTTWLEEIIGLAAAGGKGLAMAKAIYTQALARMEELTKPYSTVIEIDKTKLPSADEVTGWNSEQYCNALRHIQSNPEYNLHLRQMLHIAFKVAAELGPRYTEMLVRYEGVVASNVTENLYERHIVPLFMGPKS